MADTQTITINGRQYDVRTGMPIDPPSTTPSTDTPHHSTPRTASAQSSHVHTQMQKSHTLNRKIVHQPVSPTNRPSASASRQHMDITRSPAITRFAPRPAAIAQPQASSDLTHAPIHPFVQKAHQSMDMKTRAATPKPSQVIKKEAIDNAMNTPKPPAKHHTSTRRSSRFFSISTACLAFFLLAGYLTYLNMPTLSIRVAAVQAGINATYPDYRPDGYRLNGPIAYDDGEVQMHFAATAGPQNFTIKEERSTWNSSAVLENYIQPKANDNYTVHAQSGLTIYTYDTSAAWVNGGILYTIEGDAPLSKDQILKIATSL